MKKNLKIFFAIVVILITGYWIYQSFFQNKDISDERVLARLNTIYLLPQNATPTMAIIADINEAKKIMPSFFENAKVGDRVIIYPDVTILYDYNSNKILKIGLIPVSNSVSLNKASSTKQK